MELLMTADRQQGEKWAIFGNFEIGKLSFAKYDICQIWYTKNIIYANTRQNSQNWIKQAKTAPLVVAVVTNISYENKSRANIWFLDQAGPTSMALPWARSLLACEPTIVADDKSDCACVHVHVPCTLHLWFCSCNYEDFIDKSDQTVLVVKVWYPH